MAPSSLCTLEERTCSLCNQQSPASHTQTPHTKAKISRGGHSVDFIWCIFVERLHPLTTEESMKCLKLREAVTRKAVTQT